MKFEWHFENQDLIRANRSKMENNIFGWVFPSTDTENYPSGRSPDLWGGRTEKSVSFFLRVFHR